jgi:CBS domain-containing protein
VVLAMLLYQCSILTFACVVITAGRMSGIISERDIVRKVGLLDKDPTKVKVRDIFTPPPKLILARPSSTLAECIQLIYEYDVYRLPILDEAADICGMVSVEDCLRVVLEDSVTVERMSERSDAAIDFGLAA